MRAAIGLFPAGTWDPQAWTAPDSDASEHLVDESRRSLDAYRAKPSLVREHANIERATAQGGYGHRQLYELIQNGADALIDAQGGSIAIVLTEDALYCANQGDPIDKDGVEAILSSHVSMKRGTEIGRFGLGFKSVLGVSSSPQFFSRSASFGFDAEHSRNRISEVVHEAERTPVLRLAEPLNPLDEADADPTLKSLMEWATTVVRLPRTVEDTSWLSDDLERFPAPFLLFSPHVETLILDDRVRDTTRRIEVQKIDTRFLLIDNEESSEWNVMSTIHTPSDRARADAGELSDRSELPLIWAVPIGAKRKRGSFWAFFPTEYETTLSGILNAPWKTNEDRQNLLQGEFNHELIDAAATLVVESLPLLLDAEDPGRVLDVLPGRVAESPHWADRRLNEGIYELAADNPSVPDMDGSLQVATDLQLHPGWLPDAALIAWASATNRPAAWCHHSISNADRRSRVERMFGARSWRSANVLEWLEAIVTDRSAASSISAIAALSHLDLAQHDEATLARIVLTEDGEFSALDGSVLFIRSSRESNADVSYVHPDVAADDATRKTLASLGIGVVDATSELATLVSGPLPATTDWNTFWILVRQTEPDEALRILNARPLTRGLIHVRVLSGSFSPLPWTLLPGPVVPESADRDAGIAVDVQFHSSDLELLGALGLGKTPSGKGGRQSEPWYREYWTDCRTEFLQEVPKRGSQPNARYLQFDHRPIPSGLSVLARLSEHGRESCTRALLNDLSVLAPWTIAHSTRRDSYPVVSVKSPVLWMIAKEGRFATTLGLRTYAETVGRSLEQFADVLPVAQLSHEACSAISIPVSLATIPQSAWERYFVALEGAEERAIGSAGRLYALAASVDIACPDQIACWLGGESHLASPSEVSTASSRIEFDALSATQLPLLLCTAEEALVLQRRWGLLPTDDKVSSEIKTTDASTPSPIVDEFPFVRSIIPEELALVRCSSIRVVTSTASGTTSESLTQVLDDETFYWAEESDDLELLRSVARHLDLELPKSRIRKGLAERNVLNRSNALDRLDRSTDTAQRLLAIAGSGPIRRHLPTSVVEGIEAQRGSLGDDDLARLALAVHGLDALKVMAPELEQAGLPPPQQWAGSQAAIRFVAELGFPREFAGFQGATRSPLVEVEGPLELKPLHDFQGRASLNMKAAIAEKARSLLSLPTGAGKTRVTVQSVVEMLRDNELRSPVLWVAQTDELCEQAVRAWTEVWRSCGPPSSLAVSRLWAQNESDAVADADHVVVATISKLQHCIRQPRYDWLKQASLLIIDEAHGSTGKSYTELLRWLDLDGRKKNRPAVRPLVGLTGTPFRGRSEESNEDLVVRYGRRRLDDGVFQGDPIAELQEIQVLSRVRHQILDGSPIELSTEELASLRTYRKLPSSAEERLGADPDRNKALIESLSSLPEDWTSLVFATSVAHAQLLAAQLSLDGIPAQAISAETPSVARRYYIEEFREGRLRVITNYGVLAEGFDAPAVRAVYIARPTFSPNRYQQMVGRGLRGPLNRGHEECLIVDVKDNVLQFQGGLAYREFDYLWDHS